MAESLPPKVDCLIVGAGIAGLMAATKLQAAGWSLTILDKGRGVGGRMASRRLRTAAGEARCDHGAQYFTNYSAEITPYINSWLDQNIIREWAQGFNDSDGHPHINGKPRYIGTTGMTAVAKHLAQTLPVQTATRVSRIDFTDSFVVTCEDGAVHAAHRLLLTPPAEQTLALLDAGSVTLPPSTRSALEAIEFEPCFAVLAVLDAPSKLPEPGGMWPVSAEPISWIADNQQKGISELPFVTIHAGPDFTRQHYDTDRNEVAQRLIAHAQEWIGATVTDYQVQHWRYSKPTRLHPAPYLATNIPAPIVFAGDAFGSARVEGAMLSGLAAAQYLLNS